MKVRVGEFRSYYRVMEFRLNHAEFHHAKITFPFQNSLNPCFVMRVSNFSLDIYSKMPIDEELIVYVKQKITHITKREFKRTLKSEVIFA